jgi:23S rRNA-intervening sequence protein
MLNSQFPISNGSRVADCSRDAREDHTIGTIRRTIHSIRSKDNSSSGPSAEELSGAPCGEPDLKVTAGALNFAEARGAESRADFIQKMRIVLKELNETAVWIRIMAESSLISPKLLVDILAENKELCRMASASIRTAQIRAAALRSEKN